MVLAQDRLRHQAWLLSLLDMPRAGLILDLGCGRGQDLLTLARRHQGNELRFIGFDVSASAIEEATAATSDPRVTFVEFDLRRSLPLAAGEASVVYSNNLLECMPDPIALMQEAARILRAEGRLLVAHWDWDSQCYDSPDKALVRRIVHHFSDWQQPWMDHVDGWMGRRLRGVLAATGCFQGEMHAYVLTNTSFCAPWFGYERATDAAALVDAGLIQDDELLRFLRIQTSLDVERRYFYSITGYAFAGRKVN